MVLSKQCIISVAKSIINCTECKVVLQTWNQCRMVTTITKRTCGGKGYKDKVVSPASTCVGILGFVPFTLCIIKGIKDRLIALAGRDIVFEHISFASTFEFIAFCCLTLGINLINNLSLQ